MNRRPLRVLLVDDDEDDYLITRSLLSEAQAEGFVLEWACTLEEARREIVNERYDVYLVDYRLGDSSGLDLLREAVRIGCKAPIILLTGKGDHRIDVEAMKVGAADYLVKDQLTAPLLDRSIRHALERTATLDALRASERRLARAQQIARLGNWEIDLTTDELTWSDELYRIFGLSPRATRPSVELFWNAVHPEDRKHVSAALEDCISGKRQYNIDHRIVLPDGSERIVHEQGETVFGQDGRPIRMVGTTQDITERKRMEEALRSSELKYRNLFESANDAILIFEPENEIILEANQQALETYGFSREELFGMSLKELTKDVGRGEQQIHILLRRRANRNFESVHFKKDGTPMDILASSAVIEYGGREAILTINRDVTERKRLQQQLIQSEKMAALGQLVTGVAHELNNPLTSVIGYTHLLLEAPSLDPTSREKLDVVIREGERARRIIGNLLSFARQHKPSRSEVDLNELLDRTLELRSYEIRRKAITVQRCYGVIPRVLGDGPQLQQALLNIIINAEQAIDSANRRGCLTVTTEMRSGEAPIIAVIISDNGPGIPMDRLDKVFDPFFTTKPVGEGTGLGLSITYGIVKEHGGSIFAKSSPGQGTTFTVELPGMSEGA